VQKSEQTWPWLECAVGALRFVADRNKEPIFVMLDEFQPVIKIKDESGISPNVLGRYQEAVDSRRCPHLVTGSAVPLLTKDIIGRGSLFGSFRAVYIRGLEGYHVFELCQKLGKYYAVEVNPEMSAELARRTGGNPFYLDCIFAGAEGVGKNLNDIASVNEIISYELTQKDPILREFIEVWARVDVENATWEEAG